MPQYHRCPKMNKTACLKIVMEAGERAEIEQASEYLTKVTGRSVSKSAIARAGIRAALTMPLRELMENMDCD